MKKTITNIVNGIGMMAIMIGFIVFVGAGGNSDLGKPMTDVYPYLIKGAAMMFIGIIMGWWKA